MNSFLYKEFRREKARKEMCRAHLITTPARSH